MLQRVGQVNRRGVKRPCEEARAGEPGDLPLVHLGRLPHTILER